MLGAERRDLALDREDRVIGVGAGERIEHVLDPGQRVAAALQRLDGVGEAGRGRVGRDGGDLGLVLGKGVREGGAEMLGLDAVERRHAERPAPVLEQRIVGARVGRNYLVLLSHARHMGCGLLHCTLATGAMPKHPVPFNFSDVKERTRLLD